MMRNKSTRHRFITIATTPYINARYHHHLLPRHRLPQPLLLLSVVLSFFAHLSDERMPQSDGKNQILTSFQRIWVPTTRNWMVLYESAAPGFQCIHTPLRCLSCSLQYARSVRTHKWVELQRKLGIIGLIKLPIIIHTKHIQGNRNRIHTTFYFSLTTTHVYDDETSGARSGPINIE